MYDGAPENIDLEEVKREILEDITNLKMSLLRRYPFLALVLGSVRIIGVYDLPVPAGVTPDGYLLIRLRDWNIFSPTERSFILLHEALHLNFLHTIRGVGKDLEVWNIATDAVVNEVLKRLFEEEGIGGFEALLSRSITFDFLKNNFPSLKIEKNMTAEELYELLINEITRRSLTPSCSRSPQCQQGQQGQQQGKQKSTSRFNRDPFNRGPWSNRDFLSGDILPTNPLTQDQEAGTEGKKETLIQEGDPSLYENKPGESFENRIESFRKAMEALARKIAATLYSEKTAGDIPAGLLRELQNISEAEKPFWYNLLRATISPYGSREVRTFSRPNRALGEFSRRTGLIYPERVSAGGELIVMVDTSGSIDDKELENFASTIADVVTRNHDFQVIVIPWDAEPYEVKVISWRNKEDLQNKTFYGSGGTVILPALEKAYEIMRKKGSSIRGVIVMSDGEIYDEDDERVEEMLKKIKSRTLLTLMITTMKVPEPFKSAGWTIFKIDRNTGLVTDIIKGGESIKPKSQIYA